MDLPYLTDQRRNAPRAQVAEAVAAERACAKIVADEQREEAAEALDAKDAEAARLAAIDEAIGRIQQIPAAALHKARAQVAKDYALTTLRQKVRRTGFSRVKR